MAAHKKSVDEIWRELNARPPPRSSTTGIPGFGIPGVQTRTRILPNHPQQAVQDVPVLSHNQQQQQPTAAGLQVAGDLAAASGVSSEHLQQYMTSIQRTINCLTDSDRAVRKAGVLTLQAKLLKGDAATPKASPSMLQALLSGPLLQPMAALLSDPLERCRLTALQLLLEAVPRIADAAFLLPGLAPHLVARMGCTPLQETSEEVRLTGLQLVQELIRISTVKQLAPCVGDLCLLLARGLEDAFPDAKKAAAAGLSALAEKMPAGALEEQSGQLLQAVLPNLSHQHSKVRLAVLAGLKDLVLSGLPAGVLQEQLAPAIKPLTFDHTAAVREQYYAAVASWLGCDAFGRQQQQQQQQHSSGNGEVTSAPEIKAAAAAAAAAAHARCTTYASTLLPLLLLSVTDPQSSIAAAGLAAVEQVGSIWTLQVQRDQPQSLLVEGVVLDPMAVDSTLTAHSSTGDCQQRRAATAASAAAGSIEVTAEPTSLAVAAAELPPPYQGLPNAGCRAMVAALLPELLPGIVAGLKEWTTGLRSAAARALHTVLVMSGASSTACLQLILPPVITAMSDDDTDVIKLLAACCKLVGAFVSGNSWLPLIIDAVSDPKAGNASKANALVVLSCLVHAAAAAQQAADEQLQRMLIDALAAEDLRGADHVGVQTQLLAVIANLLLWLPVERVQASGQQLYLILLQLHGNAAADASSGGSGSAAANVLQLLARQLGVVDAGQIAEQYASQLLPQLTVDAGSWTTGSPHLLAFMSLLRTAGMICLEQLLPDVVQVMQPILADADRDPALRLGLLKLLDDLLEDQQTAEAFGGGNAAATLHALLLPPLVWRAGKSAAAVRFAAVTALATFMSAKLAGPEVLLAAVQAQSGLLPLLVQTLDEDWYSDVRHTACYVTQLLLQQVGSQINDEVRRAFYPELLKRLDDSSNKVRMAACVALVAFVQSAGSSYCSTNSGYLAAGVAIHMDDGDAQVAEAACQVLETLAHTKPDVVEAEIRKVQDRFRARHYCERVLAAAAAAPGRV